MGNKDFSIEIEYKKNKKIEISKKNFFLIAGPCVLEESNIGFEIAKEVKKIAKKFNIPYIFKASYTKANRTSKDSYRGIGLKKGLEQLKEIKEKLDLPILSDVHCSQEIEPASKVLDIIQIPAFLCRQTYLIENAAKTGKVINVKKGQFLAPWDVKYVIEKIKAQNNNKILITERGTMFGYNNLVVDMRSFPIIGKFECLVVFDGTHSVQLPGAGKGETAGQREMIPTLVKAAVASGCDGLFLEVHPQPEKSPSDRGCILPLEWLEDILKQALSIKKILSEI